MSIELLESIGCRVALHARPVDGTSEVCIDADQPMVAASVIKVLVAVTAVRAFESGQLDPHERVLLGAGDRTPGPSGISRFADDVELSLQDCLQPTLTISDNATTDAVLHRIGLDRVRECAAALGLAATRLPYDLAALITVLQDAGDDFPVCSAFDPAQTICTSARDQTTLLSAIWSDQAAEASGCGQLRAMLSRQLSGSPRFVAAVPPDWQVAAKSGSLYGLVRNEVGVLTAPSGDAYAVAVLTELAEPAPGRSAIDALIGRAAFDAVRQLLA